MKSDNDNLQKQPSRPKHPPIFKQLTNARFTSRTSSQSIFESTVDVNRSVSRASTQEGVYNIHIG